MKILVVDDARQIRNICRLMLEGAGHLVIETADPFALGLDQRHDCASSDAPCAGIDAIICDKDLGLAQSGVEFLQGLRQSNCRLKAVSFTLMSGGMPENAAELSRQFNIRLLNKPFMPNELKTLFPI